MKQVAKAVIVDDQQNYLLLWRDDHPGFGNDVDLPGGTIDNDETPEAALEREIQEEIGVTIHASQATLAYRGTDFSKTGTEYSLYLVRVNKQPAIALSWEHASYKWLTREQFLSQTKNSTDTYMNMVHDKISTLTS